jgi:hypothetical protein
MYETICARRSRLCRPKFLGDGPQKISKKTITLTTYVHSPPESLLLVYSCKSYYRNVFETGPLFKSFGVIKMGESVSHYCGLPSFET